MSKQPKFVYVEDNANNREVMKLFLEDMLGYQHLILFDTTADIITRLHSHSQHFDVIFLDIDILPDDGYTVCQLLRQDTIYHDAVIISVTASIRPQELMKMKEVGFNGMISKPLSFDTFPEILQRILKDGNIW
jgi:CheY-like chemotaxis protein